MLTDVIVEEDFDRSEEELWYSRKDLEHGKTQFIMHTSCIIHTYILTQDGMI